MVLALIYWAVDVLVSSGFPSFQQHKSGDGGQFGTMAVFLQPLWYRSTCSRTCALECSMYAYAHLACLCCNGSTQRGTRFDINLM
jgi:hypothetical protein